MLKPKLFLLGLTASFLLAGCQDEIIDEVKAPEPEAKTPEEQIAELQDDYKEIIAETDSDYGKLIFYSIENDENAAGVGLAVFNEENGEWVYSKGTTHLIEPDFETVAYPSDRIELNDKIKLVYGYTSKSTVEEIQEVDSEDLVDGNLLVSGPVLSYTFVSPEQAITVLPD
ncbi:hypothetical protein [Planomicrobium okeanokoites]|uniref:hypothetical protein n=1 Tax=Planomicrobium okeanokoites TaxID=244 RepID=UPI000A0761A0|nr:hypothetical protein [Planomicrobium okeanokoites]